MCLKGEGRMKKKGPNADRHLCKTCRFYGGSEGKGGIRTCDYILIVSHTRGCPAEWCDKHEPGKRPRVGPARAVPRP